VSKGSPGTPSIKQLGNEITPEVGYQTVPFGEFPTHCSFHVDIIQVNGPLPLLILTLNVGWLLRELGPKGDPAHLRTVTGHKALLFNRNLGFLLSPALAFPDSLTVWNLLGKRTVKFKIPLY